MGHDGHGSSGGSRTTTIGGVTADGATFEGVFATRVLVMPRETVMEMVAAVRVRIPHEDPRQLSLGFGPSSAPVAGFGASSAPVASAIVAAPAVVEPARVRALASLARALPRVIEAEPRTIEVVDSAERAAARAAA